MIYRFFLFKSAGLENGSLSPSVRACFAKSGVAWSSLRWPGEETLKLCEPFDVGSCVAAFGSDPILSRIPLHHLETVRCQESLSKGTDAGLVVKCHIRRSAWICKKERSFHRRPLLRTLAPFVGTREHPRSHMAATSQEPSNGMDQPNVSRIVPVFPLPS